jgi:hypothetical protein
LLFRNNAFSSDTIGGLDARASMEKLVPLVIASFGKDVVSTFANIQIHGAYEL